MLLPSVRPSVVIKHMAICHCNVNCQWFIIVLHILLILTCSNPLEKDEVNDLFKRLKAKIEAGEGGNSLRLAFRRFKRTLSVGKGGEGVNFKGFANSLKKLGIKMSETNARKVFDRIDENSSGM